MEHFTQRSIFLKTILEKVILNHLDHDIIYNVYFRTISATQNVFHPLDKDEHFTPFEKKKKNMLACFRM